MAHAQQEIGFRAIGPFGFLLGGDQVALVGLFLLALLRLLGQVLLDDVIDKLEGGDHVARVVHFRHGELVVVQHAAVDAAVGARVLGLVARQNAAQVFHAQLMAQAVAVLVLHAVCNPALEHAFVREHLVLKRHHFRKVVVDGDLQDFRRALVDVGLVDVAVVARKDVEDGNLLLEFALMGLLGLALPLLLGDDVIDVLEARDDVVGVVYFEVFVLVVVHFPVCEHAVVAAVFAGGAQVLAHLIEADGIQHGVSVLRMHAFRDVLLLHDVVVVSAAFVVFQAGGHITVQLQDPDFADAGIDEVDVGVVARERAENRQALSQVVVVILRRCVHVAHLTVAAAGKSCRHALVVRLILP